MSRRLSKSIAARTLFLFAWLAVVSAFLAGQEQDPLTAARQAMNAGLLDEAAAILEGFIRGQGDPAEERSRLAEANYLLARIHFDQKNGEKSDTCLREVLRLDPDYDCLESNLDFRDRFLRLRREMIEKASTPEERGARKRKKKFPLLLAAVGLAATVVAAVMLVSKGKGAGGSHPYLEVDAKGNCFDLKSGIAASIEALPGDYDISMTGRAYRSDSTLIDGIFVRYRSNSSWNANEFWPIGRRHAIIVGESSFYAFFVDWNNSDNSGSVELGIGESRLVVDARTHCLSLDNSLAARIALPAGHYSLLVSGWAMDTGGYFRSVFIHYVGTDGLGHSEAVPLPTYGSGCTIDLGNTQLPGLFTLCAFFFGAGEVGSNQGRIKIEFVQ